MFEKGIFKDAEQIYVGEERGVEKYQYVIGYLKEIGVNLSDDDLKVVIESCVQELNNWQREFIIN